MGQMKIKSEVYLGLYQPLPLRCRSLMAALKKEVEGSIQTAWAGVCLPSVSSTRKDRVAPYGTYTCAPGSTPIKMPAASLVFSILNFKMVVRML